jgi:hypothetical protein
MVQKTKECKSCNKVKPTTSFSKRTKAIDGLQHHCKDCQHERTQVLLKANKNGIIYRIINPLGETYIGKTKKKVHYRFAQHKSSYAAYERTGFTSFPKLHKSFELWGIDAHIFEELKDCGNISKEELREVETKMIIALKKNGKSLNVYN